MHRNWSGLIKPKNIEIDKLTKNYGKFIIKPLERGFGVSIANPLRRVLLSSINGAAITAVKFNGVNHEFSSIDGVKEDIPDIILNLKKINLSYFGEKQTYINLSVNEKKIVSAKDIKTDGRVEILNPDQFIATVGEGGSLDIEMLIRHGKGYVTAEENRKLIAQENETDDLAIGMIAIDSIFSPVIRVSYDVSNFRVGQMTDYDKLTFEIWTNSGVSPDDALAYGAKILKDQFSLFINFDDEIETVEEEKEEKNEDSKVLSYLSKSVDSMELSVRARNCLESANIHYIGQLVTKPESVMLKTKNFGRKSLNEIKDILSEMGLSLGMKIPNFDPDTLIVESEKKDMDET